MSSKDELPRLLADGGDTSTGTTEEGEDRETEAEPRVEEDFPVEGNLSPPFVRSPLYACAQAVSISGFVPGATVRVFANGNKVGQANPHFGSVTVQLNRPLEQGDKITATQEVKGVESNPSLPVEVQSFDGTLHAPRIARDCFECGVIVDVGNVIPGSRIEVYENGTLIGTKDAANEYHPVWVDPLTANADVTARLVRCPDGPGDEVEGPMSTPKAVRPEPSPVAAPQVQEPKVGNDTIALRNLYIGAGVEIEDRGNTVLSGWFSNESSNWFPVDPPVGQNSVYQATQELCGQSPSSTPTPSKEPDLDAPTVRKPICPGAQYVRIGNTEINANVVLYVDGQIAGYGGAVAGELILGVAGGTKLQAGQTVEALQYMGSAVSPRSAPVAVASSLPSSPDVEVAGGRTLIDPQIEERFTGFVREESSGVTVRTMTCCEEGGFAVFLNPNDDEVATVELNQIYPGYYKARWDWNDEDFDRTSLEPGTYTVRIRTECEQDPGEAMFEVVIGSPDRTDSTPPSVRLEAIINGDTYTLSDADQNPVEVTVEQSQGVDIEASVVGRDSQGLKRTELITGGVPSGANINGRTILRPPARAPIPTELTIDPVVHNVRPPATVTLRGEAQNFSGNQTVAERSTPKFRLTVEQPPEPPSVSLTANPSIIGPNSNTQLSWQSSNAKQLTINQGIGSVPVPSGSQTVSPSTDTTYRIEAKNDGLTDTDTASVQVQSRYQHTTTLTLFWDEERYSRHLGQTIEAFQQTDPLTSVNDQGARNVIIAAGNYGIPAKVTGIKNITNYEILVYMQKGGTWELSNKLAPGDSIPRNSRLLGNPFTADWEVYTKDLGVYSRPSSVDIEVSWEVNLP